MISLLKSKSDFFNTRAIFISADKVSVHHLVRNELSSSYLFDVDNEGRANFKRYLAEAENTPAYVLIDIIEEEFRQDTIPHVYGSDRDALIKRKQGRLFRDAKYQYAHLQGREEDGRRDDKYLFTALTNNEILEPWLSMLDENKVPVKGILSLPQLLQSYIQTIPNISDHALIVSMQSISGLRQTFFLKKQLKISRLSKLPRFGTEPYAPKIASEIDKIQRYLNSLRLVPSDKNLDVYVLADKKTLDEFEKQSPLATNVNYRHLNVQELAAAAGLKIEQSIPFAEQLFISHLLKSSPPNYYASNRIIRYAKMRRLRVAMNVCSILLLVFSLAYSGYGLMGALLFKQQAEDSRIKADFYQARYRMAKERLPATPVDSYKIKTAVDAADTLYDYKSSPYSMMSIVGQTMELFPAIQLDDLSWQFSISPEPTNEDASGNRSQRQDIVVADTTNEEFKYYQVSRIKAHISPFDGDYRKAIALVNSFAETLREQQGVYDVTVTSFPLDISSSATLQGTAEVTDREALFSLQTVVGIN